MMKNIKYIRCIIYQELVQQGINIFLNLQDSINQLSQLNITSSIQLNYFEFKSVLTIYLLEPEKEIQFKHNYEQFKISIQKSKLKFETQCILSPHYFIKLDFNLILNIKNF